MISCSNFFYLIFTVLIVSFAKVYPAPIASYFKKPENKGSCLSIRNVDFIYMINLDQRPEKYAESLKELEPYGVVPCRFSAVNGWELSFNDVNDLGVIYSKRMRGGFMGTCYFPSDQWEPHHEPIATVGRTYFCHCMARGPIGCILSHLSVLQDAYDSGYDTIWIMEDDILVVKDPHLISQMIDRLDRIIGKDEWDVLYTDPDTKNSDGEYVPCLGAAKRPNFNPVKKNKYKMRKAITPDLRRVGARFGTYSMIIRRSGMGKILKYFKTYKLFLPYDMDLYMIPGIRLFTTREDVVTTRMNAISDNGVPRYLDVSSD